LGLKGLEFEKMCQNKKLKHLRMKRIRLKPTSKEAPILFILKSKPRLEVLLKGNPHNTRGSLEREPTLVHIHNTLVC
jgi:hypothetical protein